MMRIPVWTLDAFTSKPFAGNSAAVCLLDRWLPDATLQAIAQEHNLSETAFVVPEEAAYRLRWFTPAIEVDLCGHATLAAASVLLEDAGSGHSVEFMTRSGLLRVQKCDEGFAMDFPRHPVDPVSLDPAHASLFPGFRGAFTNNAGNLLVEVSDEEQVADFNAESVEPEIRAMSSMGVILTAPGRQADFVSRYFAPNAGILEDPVTGSAHCMLAPFWATRLQKSSLLAWQTSCRKGELRCSVEEKRVILEGSVCLFSKGEILLAETELQA